MKKQLLWLLAAMPLGIMAQQAPFTIKGQLKNYKSDSAKVYMYYDAGGNWISDSTTLIKGKYSFKGSIDVPALITVINGRPSREAGATPGLVASFFIEPGTVTVKHTGSFANAVITNSPANAHYARLKQELEPITKEYEKNSKEFNIVYPKGDEKEIARLRAEFRRIMEEKRLAHLKYFNSNPTSPIAMYVLEQGVPMMIKAGEIDPYYNKLTEKAKLSSAGKALKSKLDIAKATGIGQTAPDFTQNDTLDKPIQLSSFRGKYVLIDFWASWCKPCRAENPNVVLAFNKFKDKNFTVLGVSLDNPGAKAKWIKAINDDGLTWPQVSDLKGWSNAVAKAYGVMAIPQNLLIDPKGKIIAKDLRGEELQKRLAELL